MPGVLITVQQMLLAKLAGSHVLVRNVNANPGDKVDPSENEIAATLVETSAFF